MTRLTVLAAASALAVLPAAAMAANAQHPYTNINRRVDAGNNTGDSQVDALNQQQLNKNGTPGTVGQPGPGTPPPGSALGYPVVAPPVVYYPPPPLVVAPYPYYARPYPYYYYPY